MVDSISFFNYVFKKQFGKHYLFIDAEVLNEPFFNNKIQILSKEIGSKGITLTNIISTKERKQYRVDEVLFSNKELLFEQVKKRKIHISEDKKDYSFDSLLYEFYLEDSTSKWCLCYSDYYEIAILGVDCDLIDIVDNVIAPYAIESLNDKLNFIKNSDLDIEKGEVFIKKLKNTYSF